MAELWLKLFTREVASGVKVLHHRFIHEKQAWLNYSITEKVLLTVPVIITLSTGIYYLHTSHIEWDIPRETVERQLASSEEPSPVVPKLENKIHRFDLNPVRSRPDSFPPRARKPTMREKDSSGTLLYGGFNADRDLVRLDAAQVWWESEHDDHTQDTEDDRMVHRALEEPFTRLLALLDKEAEKYPDGIVLKVQDSYRPVGVHHARSLHKEGRAMDLTTGKPFNLRTPGLPLSELAKLCYMAGFDWVYYELSGGAHIHVSCRP